MMRDPKDILVALIVAARKHNLYTGEFKQDLEKLLNNVSYATPEIKHKYYRDLTKILAIHFPVGNKAMTDYTEYELEFYNIMQNSKTCTTCHKLFSTISEMHELCPSCQYQRLLQDMEQTNKEMEIASELDYDLLLKILTRQWLGVLEYYTEHHDENWPRPKKVEPPRKKYLATPDHWGGDDPYCYQ